MGRNTHGYANARAEVLSGASQNEGRAKSIATCPYGFI
jgi:hypothetical protein